MLSVNVLVEPLLAQMQLVGCEVHDFELLNAVCSHPSLEPRLAATIANSLGRYSLGHPVYWRVSTRLLANLVRRYQLDLGEAMATILRGAVSLLPAPPGSTKKSGRDSNNKKISDQHAKKDAAAAAQRWLCVCCMAAVIEVSCTPMRQRLSTEFDAIPSQSGSDTNDLGPILRMLNVEMDPSELPQPRPDQIGGGRELFRGSSRGIGGGGRDGSGEWGDGMDDQRMELTSAGSDTGGGGDLVLGEVAQGGAVGAGSSSSSSSSSAKKQKQQKKTTTTRRGGKQGTFSAGSDQETRSGRTTPTYRGEKVIKAKEMKELRGRNNSVRADSPRTNGGRSGGGSGGRGGSGGSGGRGGSGGSANGGGARSDVTPPVGRAVRPSPRARQRKELETKMKEQKLEEARQKRKRNNRRRKMTQNKKDKHGFGDSESLEDGKISEEDEEDSDDGPIVYVVTTLGNTVDDDIERVRQQVEQKRLREEKKDEKAKQKSQRIREAMRKKFAHIKAIERPMSPKKPGDTSRKTRREHVEARKLRADECYATALRVVAPWSTPLKHVYNNYVAISKGYIRATTKLEGFHESSAGWTTMQQDEYIMCLSDMGIVPSMISKRSALHLFHNITTGANSPDSVNFDLFRSIILQISRQSGVVCQDLPTDVARVNTLCSWWRSRSARAELKFALYKPENRDVELGIKSYAERIGGVVEWEDGSTPEYDYTRIVSSNLRKEEVLGESICICVEILNDLLRIVLGWPVEFLFFHLAEKPRPIHATLGPKMSMKIVDV